MRRRPTLALGLALAAATVGAGALAAAKRSAMPGHVPAQRAQAQTALRREADEVTTSQRDALYAAASTWRAPGDETPLPAFAGFANAAGSFALVNAGGPVETRGHPFFQAIGANGRACVTCHQPADGMSVSTASIQARWQALGAKDPLFAAIDGSNCPSLPQAKASSHSLLLNRGLFRIFLPWPPRAKNGTKVEPEFTIEVVRDPTGCNLDATYGLKSANPMVSVFRRPRPVMNFKYVTSVDGFVNVKTGMPFDRDPETGQRVSMELMADAREPTLKSQAIEAAITHLQAPAPPSPAELAAIVAFEQGLYGAQGVSTGAGVLDEAGLDGLGPHALEKAPAGRLGDNTHEPVFGRFEAWRDGGAGGTAAQRAFRASVARGADIYMNRTFWISDVSNLNSVGLGNPLKRTCSTCHNAAMTGMDLAPGWMDLGVANKPWADPRPDLPLFRIVCRPDADPHPYLGRVILTHDPGRALITGKCADVGSITMQQMRGLAARAPYFSNGSARSLAELVEFYNRRFQIRFTAREKQDLVNFLGVL
ncbi:hypothetical protein [Phenylobacterium soli]|uniref:Cytochrome c domain-containing protein n=1 Tax=Phenylobacterium soli TaxID=2170551 RepID=A0A328AAZ7_9CAUL|nr:hypothetical protein [Phenylobacterium soli]RAK51781.1 hypothetical protein DJ017_18330 [Phenylobacterium soli]